MWYIYPSPIESPIAYSQYDMFDNVLLPLVSLVFPMFLCTAHSEVKVALFLEAGLLKSQHMDGKKRYPHHPFCVYKYIIYIWRGKGVLNSESCVLNLGSFVTRHVFFVSVNRRKTGTSNALHVVAREDPDFMTWDCGSKFCRQEMKSDENYEILRYAWVTP